MRIALFTDGIHPFVVGGMQRHSFYLAKYFALNGIEVDLYHTSFREKRSNEFELLNCFSDAEKRNIRSIVIDFPEFLSTPGHYLRESYVYSCRIYEAFRKATHVDFIYAKGFTAWKLLDEKRKGYKCAPVGVNFHGYEMFQKAANLKSRIENIFLFRKPVLFNIKHADYLFSYGGKISDILLKLGIEKNSLIELPAGIEEDWLINEVKPPDKVRKFVFVGRYERRKGIEELNEALKQLIDNHEFEFHFIGPIPKNKMLVSSKIIYHGIITDSAKMKSLLRSCDILVCPSYSEGMPNVILEAMASGLAIIATNVGAVNQLVSEKNGFLLPKINPDTLLATIKYATNLNDHELFNIKKSSMEIVKNNFIWDALIQVTIDRIKEALNRKK